MVQNGKFLVLSWRLFDAVAQLAKGTTRYPAFNFSNQFSVAVAVSQFHSMKLKVFHAPVPLLFEVFPKGPYESAAIGSAEVAYQLGNAVRGGDRLRITQSPK